MKQICITNKNEGGTILTDLEVGASYVVEPIDSYYGKVSELDGLRKLGVYPLSLFTSNV